MKKGFIFLAANLFIISFAVAQSQMVNGTLMPSQKKSVIILPVKKKDSVTTAERKEPSVPTLKPPMNGLPVLAGLDTSSSLDQMHTYTVEPLKTNLKSQYLKGTLTPANKQNALFKPVPEDSLKQIVTDVVPEHQQEIAGTIIKSPLDVLDTTRLLEKGTDLVSRYGLPPQRSALRPQLISGTVVAKEKEPVIIVPVSEESLLLKQTAEQGAEANPLFPPERSSAAKDSLVPAASIEKQIETKPAMKSVLDGLDTTSNKYDPGAQVFTYTVAPKLYKHQLLSGVMDARSGDSKVFEPLNRDTLAAQNISAPDSLQLPGEKNGSNSNYIDPYLNQPPQIENRFDSSARINPDAAFSVTHVPVVTTEKNVKTNFIVNQTGRFAVRFATDQFYLNISQTGKVIDFDIFSNGRIMSNNNSKILQVGNIKVSYNLDGSIKSIGDFTVGYTYDGKVNRVYDIRISYNNAGNMEKVADMPIQYTAANKVEKIATYRVGYNVKQMVIGIDDSEGLVVFKPEVSK